jgi:hypothetical protein
MADACLTATDLSAAARPGAVFMTASKRRYGHSCSRPSKPRLRAVFTPTKIELLERVVRDLPYAPMNYNNMHGHFTDRLPGTMAAYERRFLR